MAKKAYLVKVEFTTRIVIDEKDINNDEVIFKLVTNNIIKKIDNDEVLENIMKIVEDKECPYRKCEEY